MFAAFFPPAMSVLGLSQGYIAPIFSSFTVGNVGMSVASAPLATRHGRRPILLLGVAMVSAGALLFGLVPDLLSGHELPMVGLFMLARFVQGGGGGLVSTVAMSTLSDSFPDEKGKVLGMASSAGALAFFIGPPIGGILFEAGGFRLPFILASVLPPACYMASTWFVPLRSAKDLQHGNRKETKRAAISDMIARLRQISSLRYFAPAVASFLMTCKWTTFDIGVTMWMQEEFGYTIGEASLAFSCASFTYGVFSPISGSVVDCIKTRHRRFVMISMALLACGLSSCSIGPWQLRWSLDVRKVIAYIFCCHEGMFSTFLQSPCLPVMHDYSQAALKRRNCKNDEMTTNITTSVFTTIRMCGGILGPGIGSQILAARGFRWAIPFWGVSMLCGSALTCVIISCNKGSDERELKAFAEIHLSDDDDDSSEGMSLLARNSANT